MINAEEPLADWIKSIFFKLMVLDDAEWDGVGDVVLSDLMAQPAWRRSCP